MKKKVTSFLLFIAMLVTLAYGCGGDKKENEYVVYYLNSEVTKLVPKKIDLKEKGGQVQIEELLDALHCRPSRRIPGFGGRFQRMFRFWESVPCPIRSRWISAGNIMK